MIKLTVFLCSLYSGTCLPPHTFEDIYADNFSCMLDGYTRSYDKMLSLGAKDVNENGLYIRFICQETPKIILPKPKPKQGSAT